MSKPIPPIQKYMSTSPHTIGEAASIAEAAAFMEEHQIRHLPVVQGQRAVGLVSHRDITLLQTFDGVDPQTATVGDAMTPKPYTVSANTLVNEVAAEMAENKYGSAIIVDNGKVVGVFTTTDACHALDDICRNRVG